MIDLSAGALAFRQMHWTRKTVRLLALVFSWWVAAILWQHNGTQVLLAGLVAVFGALSYFSPDSEAPLITIGFTVVLWTMNGHREAVTQPTTLLVSLLLLGFHVVCTMTSLGPGPAPLDWPDVRRWLLRTALVAGGTVVAWAPLRFLSTSGTTTPSWAPGTALLAASVGALWLMHRSARGAGHGDDE